MGNQIINQKIIKMLSKLIFALFATITLEGARAGRNLRLLENECTDENGLIIDCDSPSEDQEDDARHLSQAIDPSQRKYFKSPTYQNKTRQENMTDLWNILVPTFETDSNLNDVEPKSFPWSQFPKFFKQKANGSFCQSSDEIPPQRTKTTHT